MMEVSNDECNNGEDYSENPYAYLDRDDFTSEKFKIEIRNLPRFYGMKEFKKLLNDKLKLKLCKIKAPFKTKVPNWAFVCFRDEDARNHAITALNGFVWKNCKLSVKKAKATPDPYIRKKLMMKRMNDGKKTDETNEENANLSIAEQVKLKTTPLANMPYPQQLELKQKRMREVLTKIGQQIGNGNHSLKNLLEERQKLHGGLICDLKPILSADLTEKYRNKCEFTIGRDAENEIVIGFRASTYASGSTAVGPVDDLCHIPDNMKLAINIFREFVTDSQLDVYNPIDNSGFWKQIVARTTRLGHLMFIVGVFPQNLTNKSVDDLKTEIKNFFENGKGKEAKVTSLYLQAMHRIESQEDKEHQRETLHHLSGSTHIEETVFDLKFRISPLAFFQVNTAGAEILFKAAIDLANCSAEDTSMIDVCCGTGTIALSFAKHASEVLGLEMIADAIQDAKENAKINNITNCEFFVGKAEDILRPVMQRSTKKNLIAVVDPPRAGLQHQALLSLRKTNKLKKLIYISCDPNAAMKNLIDLARPSSKQYLGQPLIPVAAIPVDMFPHTNHCELILVLERLDES